tara:strand:+ start:317 stop:634 length:318 start_codon:yes stop_codon:yes gene_type:complete
MRQHTTGSFSAEDILKELVDQAWFEDSLKEVCTPSYVYKEEDKGAGDTVWLYSTTRKTYVPLKLNVKVDPVEDMNDYVSGDSVICMIGHEMFLIPYDNILNVGYN